MSRDHEKRSPGRAFVHWPGTGILLGLWVTARNFIGSFFEADRLVTVPYPERRESLPENARNFPFLVYDGGDPEAGLRCVACQICEKACPPQCIYIVRRRDENGKVTKHPEVFDIDISVCMSCQICVEVCPFEAIKMDQEFELAATDRFAALLLDKARLAKPNTYYHRLHPSDAAISDAALAAKAKK
jgi:NADH-quinone oxidoreductase subunit I